MKEEKESMTEHDRMSRNEHSAYDKELQYAKNFKPFIAKKLQKAKECGLKKIKWRELKTIMLRQ